MNRTDIGWTDVSWPIVNGCRRISPGCERCYSERLTATRLKHLPKYAGLADMGVLGTPHWTGETRLWEPELNAPLKRKKPARVFVADMGDLFFEGVTNETIAAVYAVMHAAHQHTFQVLTKRPERRQAWVQWMEAYGGIGPYVRSMTVARKDEPDVALFRQPFDRITRTELINGRACRSRDDAWMQVFNAAAVWYAGPRWNVWEGVSVESRDYLHRIDTLRATPAAIRFLSLEPLLEDLGPINLDGIGWVIVGGESGPKFRECEPEWIDDIVEQCVAASVPVFVKQDSNRRPGQQGRLSVRTWSFKEFPA